MQPVARRASRRWRSVPARRRRWLLRQYGPAVRPAGVTATFAAARARRAQVLLPHAAPPLRRPSFVESRPMTFARLQDVPARRASSPRRRAPCARRFGLPCAAGRCVPGFAPGFACWRCFPACATGTLRGRPVRVHAAIAHAPAPQRRALRPRRWRSARCSICPGWLATRAGSPGRVFFPFPAGPASIPAPVVHPWRVAVRHGPAPLLRAPVAALPWPRSFFARLLRRPSLPPV